MSEDSKPDEKTIEAKDAATAPAPEERATGKMAAIEPSAESDAPAIPESPPEPPIEVKAEAPNVEAPKVEAKPEPKPEPKPEATPPKAERTSRETIGMPAELVVGAPPAVPGDVDNPASMPGPKDVPSGSPTDPANAPGRVPAGDSRSLRLGGEFALIYRQGTAVITRFGAVGTRGQWRVVEYPTPSSASNAYAKECSRFVGEGFSDYRD